MKKSGILIFFFILMAVVTTASAEIKAGSFSVAPFAGGYFFEGNEDLKDTYTVGLRAGYNFTENLGLEGYLYYVPTELDVFDVDVEMYSYGIEGIYHFMPDSSIVPFVALGIGGINYDAPRGMDNEDKFSVDYGAGLKYFITDDIALRADIRHVLPLDDRYNDLLFTLGVNFVFGGQEKEIAEDRIEEPPPSVEVLLDTDKDGVLDKLDRCPETPSGVAVDRDGCPLDSDNDGISDSLDKCHGTPAGAAVDNDGCPLDSDNDGVADYLDKCQGTPAGMAVGSDGCPLPVSAVEPKMEISEKVLMTLNVEFDTAKAKVKKRYHDEIKKVADFMKEYPETTVIIEGHTDNVDIHNEPGRNIRLSQARADSIRQYLIDKFGIDSSRISAIGYGPNRPIVGNDTAEGRKKNRRVEAVIEAVQTKAIQ